MSYKVPQLALRMVKERTLTLPHDTASDSDKAAAIAHAMIGDRPVEHMIAICIDGQAHVTAVVTLAIGGMHGAACTVRDVMRAVLTAQASAFILAHNHPSGDATPSSEDRDFTASIAAAAKIVGVPLLDHVIVTRDPHKFRTISV